jgi:lysophospholipase L1-like esterase
MPDVPERSALPPRLVRLLLALLAASLALAFCVTLLPGALGLGTMPRVIGGNATATVAFACLLAWLAAGGARDGLAQAVRTGALGFLILAELLVVLGPGVRVKPKAAVWILGALGAAAVLALFLRHWIPPADRAAGRAVRGLSRLSRRTWLRAPAVLLLFAWFAALAVLLPLEFVLRTDWSVERVFGVMERPWPRRIRPTVNARGFRDREHDTARPPGVSRIVILGDSLTWGRGVADAETWPRRLAGMLPETVELVVLARPGWSTADQLRALERTGLSYDPDLVLLGVCTNDPEPPEGVPGELALSRKVFRLIPLDLQAFRFLDERLNAAAARLGLRQDYHDWEAGLYDPAGPAWAAWRRTVARLAEVLATAEVPALAVTLPSQTPPGRLRSYAAQHAALAEAFSAAGIPAVDLYPAFRERFGDRPYRSLWALPNDGHPSAELHAFYAEAVRRLLAERGLPGAGAVQSGKSGDSDEASSPVMRRTEAETSGGGPPE